ncbi:MAG: DUF2007 domain-containing protein [Armatimonadota bacterium]|nr:DUF2007 domain-containing protein [bacterium]
MPYCPECRYEYRPGFTTCPDCNVELVDELPKEEFLGSEETRMNLVTVETFLSKTQANMAKMLLESCGIPTCVTNSHTVQTDIHTVFADGGLRLKVREQDAAEAARILAEDHQQSE